jgi:hypothetical protein
MVQWENIIKPDLVDNGECRRFRRERITQILYNTLLEKVASGNRLGSFRDRIKNVIIAIPIGLLPRIRLQDSHQLFQTH